jgi:hypothetical protein
MLCGYMDGLSFLFFTFIHWQEFVGENTNHEINFLFEMITIKRKQGSIVYHVQQDTIDVSFSDLEIHKMDGTTITFKKKKNELEDYVYVYFHDIDLFSQFLSKMEPNHPSYQKIKYFQLRIELHMMNRFAKIDGIPIEFNDELFHIEAKKSKEFFSKIGILPFLETDDDLQIYKLQEDEYNIIKMRVMAQQLEINRVMGMD